MKVTTSLSLLALPTRKPEIFTYSRQVGWCFVIIIFVIYQLNYTYSLDISNQQPAKISEGPEFVSGIDGLNGLPNEQRLSNCVNFLPKSIQNSYQSLLLHGSLLLSILDDLSMYTHALSPPHCFHIPFSHIFLISGLSELLKLLLGGGNPERVLIQHFKA